MKVKLNQSRADGFTQSDFFESIGGERRAENIAAKKLGICSPRKFATE
jgi:hypothetical protein